MAKEKQVGLSLQVAIKVSESDLRALSEALSCEVNPDVISKKLAPYAAAGVSEYVEMLLERTSCDRIDQLRDTRILSMLLNRVFDDFPTEDELGAVLRISPSRARSWLDGALSRQRSKSQDALNDAAKAKFQAIPGTAAWGDQEKFRLVEIPSRTLVEYLNSVIRKKPKAAPLRLHAGTSAQYEVRQSGYEAMAAALVAKKAQ
jgi:hypothetical protein